MMKKGFGKGFCSGILVAALTVGLGVSAMAASNNMLRKYGALDAVFGQEQYAQIPLAVVGIVMKFFQIVISIVVGMAAGCIPMGWDAPLFAYNGTTYAPVRSICEAAGLKVDFDSANYTAVLTTPDRYIASTPSASNYISVDKAKEIALSMYNRGADFVQHIAGASGMGVFTAAKEADRYAFGVGGNQNYIEPDYIVATALRDVNTIVYNEIKALVEGTWEPGVHISGIAEGSGGFDNTDSNVVLPDDIAAAVEDIKAKSTAGERVPCETAEELDAWVAANQYQPAE